MGARAGIGLVLVAALACGGGDAADAEANGAAAVASADSGSITGRGGGAQADTGQPLVLFIGTSLTAGLGLDLEEAYPARVAELAERAGTPIRVENAGLSGETSAGALERAGWVLRQPADIVVIETGANDGLRGLDPAATQRNIEGLVEKVRTALPAARVVLVQMEAPPNLGARYTSAFRGMYPAVADEYDIPLVPFLLDSVAGVARLNQPDGIHPTAEGSEIIARTVWRTLGPVVDSVRAR